MKIQSIFYANPDSYPPIINSARVSSAAGHQMHIFCRTTGAPPNVTYPPFVTVERMSVNARNTMLAYLAFVRMTLRQSDGSASVFVGHDMHGFLIARLLSARFHRPLVYHCHDFAERGPSLALGGRLVKTFEERYARTAEIVIVPDAERAQAMGTALRLPRPPLIVANAPLKRPELSTRLQELLAERGHDFSRILFRQGRIGVGHAIEATVRSLPHWQDPSWGFVVMGFADDDYINHLHSVARQEGVGDRFVILPPVAYDEVARFTTGASVGHALYEPLHVNNRYITTASNKIMEYMAAGLPILTSDQPGLRALVERYNCGLTADESDPASIAAAVNALLGDPQRARQMGANGANAFDEEFRYDKQFAPVLAAITELASRRRS